VSVGRSARAEISRYRRGGGDDVEGRSPRKEDLATLGEVKRDDVKWDGRVAQVSELDVASYEATQPAIGDEVVAMPGQAHEECAETQREYLLAAQLVPYASWSAVSTVCGREATNAALSAPAEVPTSRFGDDALLVEAVQHPGLHGAKARITRQHEGRWWAPSSGRRSTLRAPSDTCHGRHGSPTSDADRCGRTSSASICAPLGICVISAA
jgi:hypothetical protein